MNAKQRRKAWRAHLRWLEQETTEGKCKRWCCDPVRRMVVEERTRQLEKRRDTFMQLGVGA